MLFLPAGGRLRADAYRLHLVGTGVVGTGGRPMHISARPADVFAAMHIVCIT
jgi:hypothetical protein